MKTRYLLILISLAILAKDIYQHYNSQGVNNGTEN